MSTAHKFMPASLPKTYLFFEHAIHFFDLNCDSHRQFVSWAAFRKVSL
jgi:hypothetical protein